MLKWVKSIFFGKCKVYGHKYASREIAGFNEKYERCTRCGKVWC